MEKNVAVLVFGPTIDNPDVDHVGELSAVPSVEMPGRPEYRITTWFPAKSKKRLEEFNPDIIHIATPDILGFKALKWADKAGIPIVSSYHTHFTSYLKYYNLGFIESLGWKYLRWFYKHCEQIYVPTESMADELRSRNIGSSPDSLKIWARGVDAQQFNPSKRDLEWRRELGFRADDVVFTFVSRLVWEKNLKIFANVVTELQKQYPHVQSMIVGDGPARDEMQELLPKTKFPGFLKGEHLARSYASSDVFFFPSDTETFGNVTLEAMASGLPCLVADAPGSKSLVSHQVNGFLVAVENEGRFLEFAEKLASDEDLRIRMGESSLQKSKDFTWNKINSELLNSYRVVLEKNS